MWITQRQVPNIALKAAVRSRTEIFLQTYNCLLQRVFARYCSLRKLVLLPNVNRPPVDPSSYRLMCLLKTAEKSLERIIANRIEEVSERKPETSRFDSTVSGRRSRQSMPYGSSQTPRERPKKVNAVEEELELHSRVAEIHEDSRVFLRLCIDI